MAKLKAKVIYRSQVEGTWFGPLHDFLNSPDCVVTLKEDGTFKMTMRGKTPKKKVEKLRQVLLQSLRPVSDKLSDKVESYAETRIFSKRCYREVSLPKSHKLVN
jgi:hypothetical protein